MRSELAIKPAPSQVQSCILPRQVQISDWLYEEVGAKLLEAIGEDPYFSGAIDFEAGRISCQLTASVIVYRRPVSYPEGEAEQISDLVFIWWEFHTYKDGEDLPNDFQSIELKKYIL